MSAELEGRANSLRKEALQCITIALAGSDTRKFWELLVAYFGANHTGSEEDDPWDFLDAAPKIPPPLPLTDTDTDDDVASTQSAPPAVPPATSSTPAPPPGAPVGVGPKSKETRKSLVSKDKDTLPDVCPLSEAVRMIPHSEDTTNITGVPDFLQINREQKTSPVGGSLYVCRHEACQKKLFIAQSPAGLYSHVRRKHLGIALVCGYCPRRLFWNSKGWKSHMRTHHPSVPWYGPTAVDEAKEAEQMFAQVTDDPLSIGKQSRKQERRYRKGTKDSSTPKFEISVKVEPSATAVKQEASSSSSEGSEGSTAELVTEDTSPDSSSESDTSTESKDSPERPRCPLSEEQLGYVMEGATALHAQPTDESLAKYPFARPVPTSVVAIRDIRPTRRAGAEAAAASLVMADRPMEEGEDEGEEDPDPRELPPLEERPPPLIAAPPKKRRKDHKD